MYDTRKQDLWPAGPNKQTLNNSVPAKHVGIQTQPGAKGNIKNDPGKEAAGLQPKAPNPQKPKGLYANG